MSLKLLLIVGFLLSPLVQAKPYSRMMHPAVLTAPANCVFPDGTTPAGNPEVHCYEPSQFLKAYGIDQLHAQGITGKGQVIILADSFGSPTLQADLDHFSNTFHLPRTQIQFIYPNGKYINPLKTEDQVGWAGETTLDLEWAHAIAPDAVLVNIVTNTAETVGLEGFPDLFKGIQMAIKKYPGSIISMSFGTGEPTFTANDIQKYLQGSFHQILQDASNANISLLASTGDSGSTNLDAAQKNLIASPNASYPATDPLITAVGGTALESGWKWVPQGTIDTYWSCQLSGTHHCPDFLASTPISDYRNETVWNEQWSFAAGGGGVSTLFSTPDFQSNLNADARQWAQGKRVIPDVALNAAINGGVEIYTSYTAEAFGAKGPSWQNTGGTSCAAPETAALVALAGQKASDQAGKKLGIGFLNPLLYSLPASDFNDIIAQKFGATGQMNIDNNALYYSLELFKRLPKNSPPAPVAGYPTTSGYDLATGLGTPIAPKFVADLAAARLRNPVR